MRRHAARTGIRGECDYRLPAYLRPRVFHALAGSWSGLHCAASRQRTRSVGGQANLKDDETYTSIESNPHDFSLQPCAISALRMRYSTARDECHKEFGLRLILSLTSIAAEIALT